MGTQKRFGPKLADLRKDAGLTQGELADKLGVSQATVSNWETGRALLPGDHYRALADAIGLDLAQFTLLWTAIAPVEEAIVADDKLTRKEQDALLAHYGSVARRDSLALADIFRQNAADDSA